jgi:hypothetical protein
LAIHAAVLIISHVLKGLGLGAFCWEGGGGRRCHLSHPIPFIGGQRGGAGKYFEQNGTASPFFFFFGLRKAKKRLPAVHVRGILHVTTPVRTSRAGVGVGVGGGGGEGWTFWQAGLKREKSLTLETSLYAAVSSTTPSFRLSNLIDSSKSDPDAIASVGGKRKAIKKGNRKKEKKKKREGCSLCGV